VSTIFRIERRPALNDTAWQALAIRQTAEKGGPKLGKDATSRRSHSLFRLRVRQARRPWHTRLMAQPSAGRRKIFAQIGSANGAVPIDLAQHFPKKRFADHRYKRCFDATPLG
jgi:hypothetical protein